jgi:ABC-type phosphate transport system substrate-binding protein
MALYNGKIKRWDELNSSLASLGRIYPITREFGDATIRVLERVYPAFTNLPSHELPVYYSTPKAVEAVKSHKRAIAFLPMPEAVNAGLDILKIDNYAPNLDNITTGKYKLVEPFSIVYHSKLRGLAKKFVVFLFSDQARLLMINNNISPIKATNP